MGSISFKYRLILGPFSRARVTRRQVLVFASVKTMVSIILEHLFGATAMWLCVVRGQDNL